MSNARVRVNSVYRYKPNGWDKIMPTGGNNLKAGQLVKVVNLPGAPRANTMGQCYVADINTGKFLCMVSTGSLEKMNTRKGPDAAYVFSAIQEAQ